MIVIIKTKWYRKNAINDQNIQLILIQRRDKAMLSHLDEQLQHTSQDFMRAMKQLEHSPQQKMFENTDLKAFSMHVDNRVVMRVQVVINLNISIVRQFFADPACIKLTSNDTLKKYQLHYSNKQEIKVVSALFAGYYPVVADRQILVINTVREQNNRIYVGNRSCNYQKHKKDPDSVLALIHAAGYILEKVDEKHTKMIHLADADPCGDIPVYISNLFAHKRVNIIRNLELKISEWGKEKGKISIYY